MGYLNDNVSRAINLFKNGGFIKLTESGFATANKTYERHAVPFSKKIGVNP